MLEVALPRRYRLEQAPLAQALVQVRFPLVAHFQELAGIAAVQDALLDLLPYAERQQIQQLAIALGPAGLVPATPETGIVWKFTADDGWTFTLEPGAAALFVGGNDYHGIDDFTQRFSRVLEALHATGRIRRCDRIGVRYINVVEPPPQDERAWGRWFKRELLGWIGTGILGADTQLQSSITQTQLSIRPLGPFVGAPADIQALIRHGVVPPGTEIPLDIGTPRRLEHESYVLDLDLFIQAPQHFERAALIEQFAALHAQIDGFFRWSLTDEGAQHFGMVEL